MAVASGTVLAFGLLMEPHLPKLPYWGQWTPDLGWMEQYQGSVVRARLDTMRIPPGRFPDRDDPRALLAGDWTLEAAVVKGPPPATLAPMVNIYDAERREVVLVGALREDLVFREWSRARLLRMDQPDLRLPGVMAAAAVGDTMHIVVRRRGGERCLELDGVSACPTFTPGRSWSLLLYPEGPPEWMRKGADLLWLALLVAPVGFWSERPRHLGVFGSATGLLIALAVAATRLTVPPAGEIVAAVLGLSAGYAIRLLAVGAPSAPVLASSSTSIPSGSSGTGA